MSLDESRGLGFTNRARKLPFQSKSIEVVGWQLNSWFMVLLSCLQDANGWNLNVGRKLYVRVDISKKNALGRTMNNVCCAIALKLKNSFIQALFDIWFMIRVAISSNCRCSLAPSCSLASAIASFSQIADFLLSDSDSSVTTLSWTWVMNWVNEKPSAVKLSAYRLSLSKDPDFPTLSNRSSIHSFGILPLTYQI